MFHSLTGGLGDGSGSSGKDGTSDIIGDSQLLLVSGFSVKSISSVPSFFVCWLMKLQGL